MALLPCPECHNNISDKAESCPNCGAKLSGICPECKSFREPSDQECRKCGFPFPAKRIQTATAIGRTSLKWVVRVILFIAISIAYLVWREAAAKFGYDNLIMAFYRGATLGVAFIVLWVLTNKIDGSHSKFRDTEGDSVESPYFWAVNTLIVCISIAVGFVAHQFLYARLTDQFIDPFIANIIGIIVFIGLAIATFRGLNDFLDSVDPSDYPLSDANQRLRNIPFPEKLMNPPTKLTDNQIADLVRKHQITKTVSGSFRFKGLRFDTVEEAIEHAERRDR